MYIQLTRSAGHQHSRTEAFFQDIWDTLKCRNKTNRQSISWKVPTVDCDTTLNWSCNMRWDDQTFRKQTKKMKKNISPLNWSNLPCRIFCSSQNLYCWPWRWSRSGTFQGTVLRTAKTTQNRHIYIYTDTQAHTKLTRYFWRESYLCCWTLELQEHHGTGTLHDVKVEQEWLVPTIYKQSITFLLHTVLAKGVHRQSLNESLMKLSPQSVYLKNNQSNLQQCAPIQKCRHVKSPT